MPRRRHSRATAGDLAGVRFRGAHEEGLIRVGVVAAEDRGDVDVHDVAVLEHALPRDAVADDLVDRHADALGVAVVVEGSGDGAVLHGEFVHPGVDVVGGDAGPDARGDQIQGRHHQAAGAADRLDVLLRFDADAVFTGVDLPDVGRQDCVLFANAAFLVFQSAAAGAQVVAPDFDWFQFHSYSL